MSTSAFKDTFIQFYSFINYEGPISFESWVDLPSIDKQIGYLYCQFYNEITLAWYKGKADFVSEEDGVSCVLQYLSKNVNKIIADSKRFSKKYVYKVCYNCIGCLRRIQRDRLRHENEISNIVLIDGEEIDLCSLVPYRDMDYEDRLVLIDFWNTIKSMGAETEKVVNHLLNGESLHKVSRRSKSYGVDPLTDVSVNSARFEEIIDMLRNNLERFKYIYY